MQVYWERERQLGTTLFERQKFEEHYARNYLRALSNRMVCGEIVYVETDIALPWRAKLLPDKVNSCSTYENAERWLLERLEATVVGHPLGNEIPSRRPYQTSVKTEHIDLGEEYVWDKGYYAEYLRHIDKEWGTSNLVGELARVDETLYRGRFKAWHYFHGAVTFLDYETARTWLIQMEAGRVPDEEMKVDPQYLGVHWVREEWIDEDNYAKNYLVSANTQPNGDHELATVQSAYDFTDEFLWRADIGNTVLTARLTNYQFKGSKTLSREHLERQVLDCLKVTTNSPDKTDGSKEQILTDDAEAFDQIKPKLQNYAPTLLEILEQPLKGTIMQKAEILFDEVRNLYLLAEAEKTKAREEKENDGNDRQAD
jgi:hypothetical protein